MQYILLVIFTLFLASCNSATLKQPSPKTPSSLPVSNQDNDINDLKVIDEDSIVGNYTLQRGMFRNQEITEGYLVVEEIDVNNYGYYYVTIAEELSPETHTGIFYKRGGQYVQKVIEDSSEAEIRAGKNRYKMSIIDNVRITQKGEILKIFIDSTKKEKLIWQRDIDEVEKSEKLKKALKDAKSEYILYYKKRCSESSEFCGDAAYTKVDE